MDKSVINTSVWQSVFDLELTAPDGVLFGFVRPEPFLHGNYRQREVSISAPGKGLQNTRQTETVLKLSVADKGLRLQMKLGLVERHEPAG